MNNNIIHRYVIRYSNCTIKYFIINMIFFIKFQGTITVTMTDDISMDYILYIYKILVLLMQIFELYLSNF